MQKPYNFDFVLVLEELELLTARLERLSADSIFAHRASGYRGNLLRTIDHFRADYENISLEEIQKAKLLSDQAFKILTDAAREIT
jgi:hypothetical protein